MMPYLVAFATYAIVLSLLLARRGYRGSEPALRPASPGAGRQPASLRVLVIGATGGTGRQLVERALERGHIVTALVRNPSRMATRHARLTIVQGDVLDEEAMARVVVGHDAVVSALGHTRFFRPTRILSEGTRHILRGMDAAGVRRFVCETALGLGDSAGRMGLYYTFFVIPAILPFYFWDKTRQERLIAESSLDWVIVRPGMLTNGIRRGHYRHGPDVGGYILTRRISRADVANFMLDQLGSDVYLRRAPGVSA